MKTVKVEFPEHYSNAEIERLLRRIHEPEQTFDQLQKNITQVQLESRLLNSTTKGLESLKNEVETMSKLISLSPDAEQLGKVADSLSHRMNEIQDEQKVLVQEHNESLRNMLDGFETRFKSIEKSINKASSNLGRKQS